MIPGPRGHTLSASRRRRRQTLTTWPAIAPLEGTLMTIVILSVLLALSTFMLFQVWRKNRSLEALYSPIADARAEVQRANAEAARLISTATDKAAKLRAAAQAHVDGLRAESMAQLNEHVRQRQELSRDYGSARALYERLKREVALVEENVEDISVGLYKPHYNFASSDEYKQAIDAAWEQQKALVKAGGAAVCGQAWEIGGDKRAGERMTKQYLKLLLRAFNGECEAAIAKVTWNNVTRMEERIGKTYEAINDLGGAMSMRIMPAYLSLKLAELRLEHEFAERKREEQEEQRRIREVMREEERAIREAEKAMRDAEAEEERNQKAIEKARAELAQARGEALEQLQLKIKHLDAALHKAHEMKEKATSMAQLTRSGYVYVISNVGSLGENVFKIGMTRRLDPMDRIWELSDASVPFDFDVHAMVYCEDAPALECAFHDRFRDRALNLVNARKEFFSVSIDEIEEVARQRSLKIELTRLAEAKEFKQTMALRAKGVMAPACAEAGEAELPISL